jgi:L-ascorbate metabolism protein UlaG (beta-lactamase superfamily)
MIIQYIANACFLIRLASGKVLLTDPWFEGPCQQTMWNFPPPPKALVDQVRAAAPDWIYISHLHHDHLHPESLTGFDRDTPVLIGRMNTPNLRNAIARLGFNQIVDQPFETTFEIADVDCRAVLFRDFHASTAGDDSLLDYDLDTSLYLMDGDGTRVFNAVDNTILAADAAGIRHRWGAPHVAMLPYASASIFPMGMSDYDEAQKLAARAEVSGRGAARFSSVADALGAPVVIPAGGEYVLGGPVAAQSRFLPHPLEADLVRSLDEIGRADIKIAKLYPGDRLDTATPYHVEQNPGAPFRGFTHDERAAHALSLSDKRPTYSQINPRAFEPDWGRLLGRCAALFQARCRKIGYAPAMDLIFQVVDYDTGAPLFRYAVRMDEGSAGFDLAAPDVDGNERTNVAYTLDDRLLFCLVTGLLNWNAIEASGLLGLSRRPDVYDPDLHRVLVHFALLS